MSVLGIELNDYAITGVSGDRVVFAEPGAALLQSDGPVFGHAARAGARSMPSAYIDQYWRDLSEQTLSRPAAGIQSFADLAYAQLAQLWSHHGGGISAVLCAFPPHWGKAELALLLGIAQEADIPLVGLTTIPVAATRRHYPDCDLIHIEFAAGIVSLTEILQNDGSSAQGQSESVRDLGVAALERTSAEYFARKFLECSRFDPMHDAQSEQSVYDKLPDWLALLARSPETELQFDYKGNEFKARVSLTELEERLRYRCQPLIQKLRARLDTGRPAALQINAAAALFPGVVEYLADLPGCDVFVLETGAAARGLALRSAHMKQSSGALSITESLPWDQSVADVSLNRAMASSAGSVPSHVVIGSRAYKLSNQPLRIGAESAEADYSLVVAPRHAGVSRQHCSIELRNGQAVLNDYSRFGTRLNGHKVEGSTILQAGDIVGIGDPACELKLIAEVKNAVAGEDS
ncbi:MAG: FHA domain-containing protein [Gammaproteobacteria bacterium]|jgi:hypothetical protein